MVMPRIFGWVLAVGRIFAWILIAAAIALAGIGIWLWWRGADLSLEAGELWSRLDPSSLLAIQRHLPPGLWDYGLLPLLQQEAYVALPVAILLTSLLGIGIRYLFRRRNRRRFFT